LLLLVEVIQMRIPSLRSQAREESFFFVCFYKFLILIFDLKTNSNNNKFFLGLGLETSKGYNRGSHIIKVGCDVRATVTGGKATDQMSISECNSKNQNKVGLFFPCGVFNYCPGGLFYYSDFTFKQLLIVLIGKDTLW